MDVWAVLLQAALQQQQAGLQVVGHIGQAQGGVQPQFAVGEVHAPGVLVVAQQLPHNGARHALDQVVVVDEHAVVGRKVAHPQRAAAHRRCRRRSRQRLGRIGRGLQQVDGGGQLARNGHQQVFILEAKAHVLGALGKQHAQQAPGRQQRHCHLAVRLWQAGVGDVHAAQRGRIGRGMRVHALADGVAVQGSVRHVADAHRRALARGHADHALAQPDLGAHTRGGVAAAGHRVELLGAGVQHQHHGVLDAQLVLQALQRALQQFVQPRAARNAFAAQAQRVQQPGARRGCRQPFARHRFDVLHGVDVGALELKHLGHARMRRNARQLRAHALEHRAAVLGAFVQQVQAVEMGGERVQHQHGRARVAQDVLAGLVEELERQRHMRRIHIDHLRDVGHVGRAVGVAGRHDGGNRTLQAGADAVQGRRCGAHGCGVGGEGDVGGEHTCAPARGPGVWSNALVGVKLTATTSCSGAASMAATYCGP